MVGRAPSSMLLLSLSAALLMLAVLPSAALATGFIVNSTADGGDATPGDNVCEVTTGAGDCTLRAAIGEANGHTGADSISFLGSVFDGGNTQPSTITIGSRLPLITGQTFIDGGDCSVSPAPPKPCVAVTAAGTPFGPDGFIFFTGSDGSSIARVDVYNFDRAILVADTTNNVTVQGNWLGQDLAESTGTSNTNTNNIGLFALGTNLTIGGTTPQQRNVFRSNSFGIDLRRDTGTSQTATVSGNYFGTKADGTTAVSSNGNALQIEGASATNEVIGGADTGTPSVCDGACNLFAAGTASIPSAQIELQGSGTTPSPGPIVIKGNFVGLNSDGTAAMSAGWGIHVGDAKQVTIGGSNTSDRNYIGGSDVEISAEDNPFFPPAAGTPDNLIIRNNFIGVQPDGSGEAAPLTAGVAIDQIFPTDAVRPQVLGNRFGGDSTAGQDGLAMAGNRGLVQGNTFGRDTVPADLPFGGDAIQVTGNNYVIQQNTITNGKSSGVNLSGSAAQSNQLNGNTIQGNGFGASAGPGVRIQNGASNNMIGSNPLTTPANINSFVGNSGDAIELLNDGTDNNLLIGNLTSSNNSGGGGLFVDLNGDGAGNPGSGPNEGVSAPVISVANTDHASGTAQPSSLVVLYTAQGTHPDSILASGTADVSGNWSIPYSVTDGTKIFASQTPSTTSDTSELAGPALADGTPPAMPSITATTPGSPGNDDTPAVRGMAESGSTVRLYSGATCTGSVLATGTAAQFAGAGLVPATAITHDGVTTFRVTSTDAANNTSSCSTGFSYTEDSTNPTLVIDSAPDSFTNDPNPSVTFHGSDANGVTFACDFTGASTGSDDPCTSPYDFGGAVSDGAYTAHVTAEDGAGNSAQSSDIEFTVDTVAPVTVIDSAPSGTTGDSTPTLEFHATDATDVTFACQVDSDAPAPCSSPTDFGPLGDGAHTISITGTDQAGNIETSPPVASFTVDTLQPVQPVTPATPVAPSAPSSATKKKCKKKKHRAASVAKKKKCKKKKRR
jgi:CSLREA domain-containing protein